MKKIKLATAVLVTLALAARPPDKAHVQNKT